MNYRDYRDRIKTQKIELHYIETKSIDDLNAEFKVSTVDTKNDLLKSLGEQDRFIKFNISEIDNLILSLTNAKDKLISIKDTVELNRENIISNKNYLFLPKKILPGALSLDRVEFKVVDEGYLIDINTIDKKNVKITERGYKLYLMGSVNKTRKKMIITDINLISEQSLTEKSVKDHENMVKIRLITM